MKLLLADGHNLLFRSFYGIPARILGSSGLPLNAVVGVVGMLLHVARAESVDAVLVVFDSESGSFRDMELHSYKANRVRDFSDLPSDKNPFEQLAPLKRALDTLGWCHCEIDGVEADDVIAAYSRVISTNDRAVVVSADADLLQLVTPSVTVHAAKDRVYTTTAVVAKYGVMPVELPLLRALAGDSSDNIPGVPGIGLKTARHLLQRYRTVEDLYLHIGDLPARLGQSLATGRRDVEMALGLMTLNRAVDLPYSLGELTIASADDTKTMDVLRQAGLL